MAFSNQLNIRNFRLIFTPIFGLACSFALLNYLIHNYERVSSNYYVLEKPLGIFGFESFSYYHEQSTPKDFGHVELSFDSGYFPPLNTKTYSDGGNDGACDGLVDRIDISRSVINHKSIHLTRSLNYSHFKREFDLADSVLASRMHSYEQRMNDLNLF